MILKSIEMKGFKSFPYKTQLSFPDGIVSIIGPNGSGKSNVLDAVRWVLGEKSAKNLRGEKMEDIIFSGTQVHKSMNFCEVEIVFGNEDHFLNIDFSEVAIKRKAYRNGESKFYINGTVCRQKDIKELLLDSGIGKEGYSIISQGRIDEIVSSNPLQRRRIFEEACKISKNRYQKEESERKLETVRENLERINDIYYEIEKQIKPLKNQSENAQKFLELKSELKKSDINRIILELGDVQGECEILQGLMKEKNISISDLEKNLQEKVTLEETFSKQVDELYLGLEKISDGRNQLRVAKGSLESQINSNELFLENSDRQSQKSLEQIEKAHESMVKAQGEYEKRKQELEEAKLRLEEIEQAQSLIQEQEFELSKQVQKIAGEIEGSKETLLNFSNSKNITSSQLGQYKGQIVGELKKIADIEAAKKQQELNIEAIKVAVNEAKKVYEKAKESLIGKALEQDELNDKIKEHRSLTENNLAKIANITASIKALESKKSVFDEMEAHYEGMSNSVKSVVKEKSLKGIVDVLANIVSVEEKYEKAIEAALGGAIQNIVIKTSSDAKCAIDFLKANKLGRATFLPIDSVKGQELEIKGEIIASSLVATDLEYRDIIKQLLGKTIVVETMDEGIKTSKKHGHKYRIVTEQGEIFSPGGAITGGAYVKSGNILSRKREIQDLKIAIEKEILNKQKLELIRKGSLDIISDLQKAKESLELQLEEDKKNLESLKVEIIDKENKLSYENTKLEQINLENDGIKTIQDVNKQKIASLEEQENVLTIEINQIKLKLEKLLDESEKIEAAALVKSKDLAKLREEASAYKGQLESRELVLKQAFEIFSEFEKRHSEHIEENKQLLASLEDSKEKTIMLEVQLKEVELSLHQAESQETIIRNSYSDAKNQLTAIKEQIKSIEQNRFMQVEERYQIENKLSKVEGIIFNSSTKLMDEYDLTLEQAILLRDDEANTSKNHISKLKSNISALGNINLGAIEEYEKVNERYLLFLTQKTDLELSLGELEKITLNIDKNMRKEFKKEFGKINTLFKDTFKELFGGGEGELVLADEDDILNCEIEIHAQPPGKKLKNISVMSGGEKALTAIAILFAILMTRPTPFCFLDEIDAPLDDVNIYRYNKYIKGLAQGTQFITITHRRGTMEASDYIYGVTMEDKGVSKIVSIKLEEAENYIEN